MKQSIYVKKQQPAIPKEICLDNTIKLLLEGYLYIPSRIRKYNSPLFQTRLMGQKVICMSGKQAAEAFYNQNWFTREGAVPKRIQETLFGKKAIQTLDGAAHMHRKQLFLAIMAPEQVDKLIAITRKQWFENSRRWDRRKQVVLFDEAAKVLFQSACKWAGVPLLASEAKQKSQDMSAMIDAFGAVGPRHQKGRIARNRSECWAQSIIQEVRSGRMIAPQDTALNMIAWHKDLSSQLLDTKVAAVELINILRPITAIATYVTFGAMALHMYPEYRKMLEGEDEDYPTMFAQEVRRFYPFGPFLGAKVRNDFKWHNHQFEKGTLVFLDIYGTNHDPGIWEEPNVFNPAHFTDLNVPPFDFIPQGGGDLKKGTRCPGEYITVELMKVSFDFLVNDLNYKVPLQDFNYPMNRIPTLPNSRFIINHIKQKEKLETDLT
jgi:fatty-acid peroxygenase